MKLRLTKYKNLAGSFSSISFEAKPPHIPKELMTKELAFSVLGIIGLIVQNFGSK